MYRYDKLKNIRTEEDFYDFHCSTCNADGSKKNVFMMTPIGISWKPDNVDNSDLPKALRVGYDRLPRIREALLQALHKDNDGANILIVCNECNQAQHAYKKIREADLKKWLNKHHPFIMDLKRK